MSIGYEVQLTPLQTLAFYNAIANNGRLMRPLFVKEVRRNGVTVKSFRPEIIADSICSASTLEKARRLLLGVVETGTATNVRNNDYKIAGKTGTAQTNYTLKNETRKYQASFVGYFPADAPRYSCIVVVNSPSNSVYYGGAVAAPIFKEIADKVYAGHLDLHQRYNDSLVATVKPAPVLKCSPPETVASILEPLQLGADSVPADAAWLTAETGESGLRLRERKMTAGVMPNVSGRGLRDALYVLENAGLQVKVNGRGSVMKQSVTAGSRIQPGQTVSIDLDL